MAVKIKVLLGSIRISDGASVEWSNETTKPAGADGEKMYCLWQSCLRKKNSSWEMGQYRVVRPLTLNHQTFFFFVGKVMHFQDMFLPFPTISHQLPAK